MFAIDMVKVIACASDLGAVTIKILLVCGGIRNGDAH